MTTPVIAYLMLDGGPRQTCVGCSEILAEQGMVVKVQEFPLGQDSEHTVVFYEIAPSFTLDECRDAIKARHIGPEWGS